MDEVKKCAPNSHVTLKEYFEEKFNHLEDLRAQEAKTLVIQAKEYERRLENLNNEAARIDTAATKSISRDVFETFLQGDASWKSQQERTHSSFMPRFEIDALYKTIDSKISSNSNRLGMLEAIKGRIDIMQIFTAASSIAAITSVIYVLMTRHV